MKHLIDKLTDLIASFMGSWQAVLLHAIWFFLWFLFDLDINLLTLLVSLEAIFIGIFILMAANRTEAARRRHEEMERLRDRKTLEEDKRTTDEDLRLDQEAIKRLGEIKDELTKLRGKIDEKD